jgi:hypothetical protein
MFGKFFYKNTVDAELLIDGVVIQAQEKFTPGIYTVLVRQGNNMATHRVIIND